VAELADALGSGPSGLKTPVQVQVLSSVYSKRTYVERRESFCVYGHMAFRQFSARLGGFRAVPYGISPPTVWPFSSDFEIGDLPSSLRRRSKDMPSKQAGGTKWPARRLNSSPPPMTFTARRRARTRQLLDGVMLGDLLHGLMAFERLFTRGTTCDTVLTGCRSIRVPVEGRDEAELLGVQADQRSSLGG
jgi:hypothetical protein